MLLAQHVSPQKKKMFNMSHLEMFLFEIQRNHL